jgi:hypothetical protein
VPDNLDPAHSFQGLILALQRYWAEWGCVILQPYDMEVGAGTFHPATTLRALGPKPWNAAYVQPSRRPKDGRYGEKVRTPLIEMGRGLLGRRIPGVGRLAAALDGAGFGASFGAGLGDDLVSSLEARAWWSRYGF